MHPDGVSMPKRRSALRGLALVVTVIALLGPMVPAVSADQRPAEYASVQHTETVITDREGEKLKAYLSFPADDSGRRVDGRFPVILHYTYFPAVTWEQLTAPIVQQAWTVLGFNLTEGFDDFVRRGYVVAHVALPGTGGAQGYFTFDKGRIGRSGYDAVEWLGTQSWSTGKVGMFGGSGNGIAQLMTASQQPPHLATIIPAVAFQDLYRDTLYRGGMPALGEAALIAGLGAGIWAWQGNVVPNDLEEVQYLLDTAVDRVIDGGTPPLFLAEWYAHPTKDQYWDNYTYDVDRITVPVWSWGNWDDHFLLGNVRTYQTVATPHRMLAIGANGHSAGPGFDPIVEATRWYDYWLKGDRSNGIGEELRDAPVRYYVKGANTWSTATSWPPADVAAQRRYATSGRTVAGATGALSPTSPGGLLGSDSYVYTPLSSRLGGQNGFLNQGLFGLLPRSPNTEENSTFLAYNNITGQVDQRLNALDSVTYVGPVLGDDVEVTGEPVVTLSASTTATDTDWVVRLIDVYPDDSTVPQPGYWNLVDTGWLKGTHRDGHQQPTAIPVGRPVQYHVDLWPTSYQFKKGHRIGIQIASADPRTLPNLNIAVNTVHRSAAHPTSIELPVRHG